MSRHHPENDENRRRSYFNNSRSRWGERSPTQDWRSTENYGSSNQSGYQWERQQYNMDGRQSGRASNDRFRHDTQHIDYSDRRVYDQHRNPPRDPRDRYYAEREEEYPPATYLEEFSHPVHNDHHRGHRQRTDGYYEQNGQFSSRNPESNSHDYYNQPREYSSPIQDRNSRRTIRNDPYPYHRKEAYSDRKDEHYPHHQGDLYSGRKEHSCPDVQENRNWRDNVRRDGYSDKHRRYHERDESRSPRKDRDHSTKRSSTRTGSHSAERDQTVKDEKKVKLELDKANVSETVVKEESKYVKQEIKDVKLKVKASPIKDIKKCDVPDVRSVATVDTNSIKNEKDMVDVIKECSVSLERVPNTNEILSKTTKVSEKKDTSSQSRNESEKEKEKKEGRKSTSSNFPNSSKSKNNFTITSQSSGSESSVISENRLKRKRCKRKKGSKENKHSNVASKSDDKREKGVYNASNTSDSDTSCSSDLNNDQPCTPITDGGDSEKHHAKECGLRQIDGKWYWKNNEIKFPHVLVNKMNVEKEHFRSKTMRKRSKSQKKFKRIKHMDSSSDSSSSYASNGENEKKVVSAELSKSQSEINAITEKEDCNNRNALEFLSSLTCNTPNGSDDNHSAFTIQKDGIAENENANSFRAKRQNSSSSGLSLKEKRLDGIDSDASTKSESSVSTGTEEALLYGGNSNDDEEADTKIEKTPLGSAGKRFKGHIEERTKVNEISDFNETKTDSFNSPQHNFEKPYCRKEQDNVMLVEMEISSSKATVGSCDIRSEGSVTTEENVDSQDEVDNASVKKQDYQNIGSSLINTDESSVGEENKTKMATEEIDSNTESSELLLTFDNGKNKGHSIIPVTKKTSKEMQPDIVDSDMSTRSESSVTTLADEDLQPDRDLENIENPGSIESIERKENASVGKDSSIMPEEAMVLMEISTNSGDEDLPIISLPKSVRDSRCRKDPKSIFVRSKRNPIHINLDDDGSGEEGDIEDNDKLMCESDESENKKVELCKENQKPTFTIKDESLKDLNVNNSCAVKHEKEEIKPNNWECKKESDKTEAGVSVKTEPEWSSQGYTQQDVIFLSDSDDMTMSYSLPVINLDTDDSDDSVTKRLLKIKEEVTSTHVINDPEYYDFLSSKEDDSPLSSDIDSVSVLDRTSNHDKKRSVYDNQSNDECNDSDRDLFKTQSKIQSARENDVDKSNLGNDGFNDSDEDLFMTQTRIQSTKENVDKCKAISLDERPLFAKKSSDVNEKINKEELNSNETMVNKEFDSGDDSVLNDAMKLYDELNDISVMVKNDSARKDFKLMPSKVTPSCDSQEATQLYGDGIKQTIDVSLPPKSSDIVTPICDSQEATQVYIDGSKHQNKGSWPKPSGSKLQEDDQPESISENKGHLAIVMKRVGFHLEDPKRNNSSDENDDKQNIYLQNTQTDIDFSDISDSDISVLNFHSEHFPNSSEDENQHQQRCSENEDEEIESHGREMVTGVDTHSKAVKLQRRNSDQGAEKFDHDEIQSGQIDPVYDVQTQVVGDVENENQLHTENYSDISDAGPQTEQENYSDISDAADPQLEYYFIGTQNMPGTTLNQGKGQMFKKVGLHLDEQVSDDDRNSDQDYPYNAQTQVVREIEERNEDDTMRFDKMADNFDAFNAMTQVNNVSESDDNDNCHKSDSNESEAEAYMVQTQIDPWSVDIPNETKMSEHNNRKTPRTRYVPQSEQFTKYDRDVLASDQVFDALTQRDNEMYDTDETSNKVSNERNVDIIQSIDDDYMCATQVDELSEKITTATADELDNTAVSGHLSTGELKAVLPDMHQSDGGRKRHQSSDESQLPSSKKIKPSIPRRTTISIEPQKLKSTAEKRLSGISLHTSIQTTTTAPKSTNIMKNKSKSDDEKGVLKENETNSWLSKIGGKKTDTNVDKNIKRKRRQRKEDPSVALKARMQEARCRLTERNFQSRVRPEAMATSSKKVNPTATATSSYLEDVDLPSDSQIVRAGLPVLNPTGILVKRRGSTTMTHQPDRFVSRTAGLTETILGSDGGKTCRSTTTISTTTVTIATTSQSSGPCTSHVHTSTVVSVTSKSSIRTPVQDHHKHSVEPYHSSSHAKHRKSTENRTEEKKSKKDKYSDLERPVKKVKFSDYEASHKPPDHASTDKHKKEHSSGKKHSVKQSSKSDKKDRGEIVEKHSEEKSTIKCGTDKKKNVEREDKHGLKEKKSAAGSTKERHSSSESKVKEKLPKDHGKHSDKREGHGVDKEKHGEKRSTDKHRSKSKEGEQRHSEKKHTSGRSEKREHEEKGSNQSVKTVKSSTANEKKHKSSSERKEKQSETENKHRKDKHISERKEKPKEREKGHQSSRKDEKHRSRSTSKEKEKSSKTSGRLPSEKGKSGTKDQHHSGKIQTGSRTEDTPTVERKSSVEETVKSKKDDQSGREQGKHGAKGEGMFEKRDKEIPSKDKNTTNQSYSGTKPAKDRKYTVPGTQNVLRTKEDREKVSKERDKQSHHGKKTNRQHSSSGIENRINHSSPGQTSNPIEDHKSRDAPIRETQHKVSFDTKMREKLSVGKENNVSGRSPVENDYTKNQHRDKHPVNLGEPVKPSTSTIPVKASATHQMPATSHKPTASLMYKQSYQPEPLRDIQPEPVRTYPTGAKQRPETILRARQRPETMQQYIVDKPTFSFNEFIAVILKWNPRWFQEKEDQEKVVTKKGPVAPPPVANGWFGNPTLLPLVGSYSGGYQEYSKTFMVPLLLHETWEGCYKDWRDKKANKQLLTDSFMFSGQVVIQEEKSMFYTLHGLVSEYRLRNGQYMMEGDLLKLELYGKLTMDGVEQEVSQTIMGYIKRFWLKDTPVDRICAYNAELAKRRTPGCVSIKLQVRVGRRNFTPNDQKLIQAECVSSIVSVTRQFSSLLALPNNQLCPDLLCPDSNSPTYCDRAPSTPEKIRGRYNDSQSTGINTVAKMVCLPPTTPRICLIQGPPGTGKSLTIIGIINRIIRDLNGRCRICLCAPSNSAVDELLRRIHKQNNDPLRRESKNPIPFVRLGKKSSIDPDLQCKTLDSLVEEKALENLKKEHLQKIPDSLQVEKLRLERKIKMLMKERQAAKDEFQRRKLKIDLEQIQKQKELLEKKCRPNLERPRIDKPTEIRLQMEILTKAQVISGTLSGMGHKFIKSFVASHRDRPAFDCVIVDEATQAVELDTWIPLQYGTTKLILVGDPQQLPPTVLSQVAQENQFHRSLFERLDSHFRSCTRNPVILLNVQYRMNPEIASFPNRYVYDGRIQNDESVRKNNKHFPLVPYLLYNIHEGQEHFSQSCQSLSNALEAQFTAELCQLIVKETKVTEKVIGIIAPYNRQKTEIKQQLKKRNLMGIEVSTVDGFQGREKHVIIMSCVRANMWGSIGFVGNRNRMNVSLTRAKFGMFLVGHFDALESSSDEWKSLIEDGRSRDKIVDVDEGSLQQALKRCLRSNSGGK